MAQHNIGLDGDGFLVAFDKGTEFFLGFGGVEKRIVLNGFLDFVIAFISGVIGQHVKDKTFFDRLFHRIQMKRNENAVRGVLAKFLQGRIFGCGSKGEVGRVLTELAAFHGFEDCVLHVLRFFVLAFVVFHAQAHIEGVSCFAALRRVGFIDNHREVSVGQIFNTVYDKWEFLNGGDNDLFAVFQ